MKVALFLFALVAIATCARVTDLLKNELSLKNGKADILIQMKEQVDFSKLTDENGVNVHQMKNEDARGYLVMNTLMKLATLTQASVISVLKQQKVKYTPFWVQNSIAVEGASEQLVNQLAKRIDIDFIESNKAFPLDLETPIEVEKVEEKNQNDIEWNVRFINAEKLWNLGFVGKGIVVGVSDTGIQHNHPALLNSYRGKNGTHHYNWFDTTIKSQTPEDENGHGTHCTGTAAGGSARKIGVAPGSEWIHCRSMHIGRRIWSPATFIGCLQFFLAPTKTDGTSPNPSLRPHSTSHSYGCGASLGCPDPNSMKAASDALKAAGVFMFVSAGNSGPRCNTVNTQPAHYGSVITVGASGYQTHTIASFSSRGPVTYDGSNRLKPEIMAPGQQVTSSMPGNRYAALSGTSMASPAVNGAVALLWSACPELKRKIDETMAIIYKSAHKMETTECSSQRSHPNNVYGYGTLDIYKAYQLAKQMGY